MFQIFLLLCLQRLFRHRCFICIRVRQCFKRRSTPKPVDRGGRIGSVQLVNRIFGRVHREECHRDWLRLRKTPLFGCICPQNQVKKRCDRLFALINENPCISKCTAGLCFLPPTTSQRSTSHSPRGLCPSQKKTNTPVKVITCEIRSFRFHVVEEECTLERLVLIAVAVKNNNCARPEYFVLFSFRVYAIFSLG